MSDQDPELQAIRATRLAQLQQQQGGRASGPAEQDDEQMKRDAEMKRDMLATILDPSARERLSRIAIVNPKLSNQMETILMRMAQSGQLRSRVSEAQLIGLLEQAEAAQAKASGGKSTISFQRRKDLDDDDDFDL